LLENPASAEPAGEWLVLGIDITRLRRADLERRWLLAAAKDARIEAEQANRAKSEFIANVSHELRTPLNSIIGFAEILKQGMVGPLGEQQQRFVEDICSASKHLHSLINDVLDLAKVEAGKYVLELGECRIADLLEAAAFVLRESSMRRDIRFEVIADPTLGTACLDTRKVKQVLFNLLSNAVKFSPDRSTVRLRAWSCPREDVRVTHRVPSRILPLPDADDDEFIAFAVEDDGAGIPADQMDTLFTPFGQL
jgi:signal transduction histidine kinase